MILYYRKALEVKALILKKNKLIREMQAWRKRSEKDESPSPLTLPTFSINDKLKKRHK